MSGQQIGSVAGGVIGAYFGAMVGNPQIGYAIGSAIGGAIGGYVDPTVIKGPRLTDATQQTASDGIPIPWGHGTFPTAGNIIWRSTLRERRKEDDGKGSGIVNVTYHYYRDYAIAICSGVRQTDGTYLPIEGILQVTQNGKVVYDVQPGASMDQAAQNTKFMRSTRFYLGSETQDPDSVIESHKGVGNTPAYPGIVYMVRENEEQPAGEIPQYGFVVSVCGTSTPGSGGGVAWMSIVSDASTAIEYQHSSDGFDWTGTGLSDNEISGGGLPRLVRSEDGDTLYTNPSSSQGARVALLPSGAAAWIPATTETGMSAAGGSMVRAGNYWHVCTPVAERSADGLTFEAVDGAPTLQSIGAYGDNLIGFQSSPFPGTIWQCPTDGSAWTSVGPAPSGLGAEASCIASGNGEVLLVACDDLGATVGTRLFGSIDGGETFEELPISFPDVTGDVYAPAAKYDDEIGIWVIASQTRLCAGSSLSGLSVAGEVFSSPIRGLDSDGSKFVVCGAFGFSGSFDGASWESLPAHPDYSPSAIVAFAEPGKAIPDAPGYYIDPDGTITGPTADELDRCKPTLGEIVTDVCLRAGLTLDDIYVSELTDEVDGFKVATESSGEAIIGPLMQGFFFDAAEFDDKIRFLKRGRDVVAELTVDDLCESDGDVIEETELQEVELLQKVHVKTIDPAAGFIVTTQTAERRTSTVAAKGEQTTEIAVVTDKDTQARMANKKLKVGWSETRKFRTFIPYTRPDLTVTDVIGLTDKKGRRQRVRLMEMAEDSGRIEIREAMLERQSSYTSDVEGVTHSPPTDTTPGIIGPTFGWAGNLPSLRTSDNVPGAYLAACGYLRGWGGCSVLLSVDGGVSYQEVTTFTEPSTMGVLHEDCTASSEPISVFINSGTLSSITAEQITLRMNAFAITTSGVSELGQFQTAVQDTGGIYDLTDTVRGGLGTTASSHMTGDPFVMVASAKFVQLDIALAGRLLHFKFVSYGTSPDDTEPYPFIFNPLFTSVTVSAITVSGENLTVDDSPIYVVTSNA